MKIYLDNCCFNRPFDDQTQLKIYLETQAKLFIQQEIITNTYSLVWSFILEYENKHNPYEIRRNTIIKWRDLASVIAMPKIEILEFAKEISSLGIKPKDSLHLACAVHCKCDYFITTDKKLLRFNFNEISICDPIDFIKIMEA